jgi:hypothetical protein
MNICNKTMKMEICIFFTPNKNKWSCCGLTHTLFMAGSQSSSTYILVLYLYRQILVAYKWHLNIKGVIKKHVYHITNIKLLISNHSLSKYISSLKQKGVAKFVYSLLPTKTSGVAAAKPTHYSWQGVNLHQHIF